MLCEVVAPQRVHFPVSSPAEVQVGCLVTVGDEKL